MPRLVKRVWGPQKYRVTDVSAYAYEPAVADATGVNLGITNLSAEQRRRLLEEEKEAERARQRPEVDKAHAEARKVVYTNMMAGAAGGAIGGPNGALGAGAAAFVGSAVTNCTTSGCHFSGRK